MGSVAYISPFVPAEWIAGHGLLPLRISEDCAPTGAGIQGVCAFADGVSQWTKRGKADAIILTTTCDQMRRHAERIDPSIRPFLMNVPATWQSDESQQLYRSEIQRLGNFLATLGGSTPAPGKLAQIMREYERQRNRHWVSPADGAVRIGLVGGPMRRQDHWIMRQVALAGGKVVLDATETGERTWPLPFEEIALQSDPFAEMIRCYFQGIPDAFRRPDERLHEYLRLEVKRRKIAGMLLVRFVWCDLWHAELNRMKEVLGIPIVEIELGEESDHQRLATRIESLVGILK
jgi:benzoyl-CoA reductase/2-hydroxyglutaryl-CoA dehydratase subunit BcrC/BadD/HgdB